MRYLSGTPSLTLLTLLILESPNLSLSLSLCAGCEREVVESANGVSDELKSESIMRLSWALVHSKQPKDVQCGIAMLEAHCKMREKLYLLAFGYYRSSEYRRSRQLAEQYEKLAQFQKKKKKRRYHART
ncbi:hypothetical protein CsSME_00022705 [Camellia sinensis var. sinensis]